MAKFFVSFLSMFLSISVISFVIIMIYVNLSTLELNETLGSGLFYLKGYYEEGNMIVTEQGIGVITLPLAIGLVFATLFKGLQLLKSASLTN